MDARSKLICGISIGLVFGLFFIVYGVVMITVLGADTDSGWIWSVFIGEVPEKLKRTFISILGKQIDSHII